MILLNETSETQTKVIDLYMSDDKFEFYYPICKPKF